MNSFFITAGRFAGGVLLPGLVLGVGATYLFGFANPAGTPPGNGPSAPLNSSGVTQTVSSPTVLNSAGAPSSIGLWVYKGGLAGIGTANPGAALDVKNTGSGGRVFATDYCDQSTTKDTAHCIDWSKVASGNDPDGLPSGTVLPFAGASCPAGWARYGGLDGRYPRGVYPGALGDVEFVPEAGYQCPAQPNASICYEPPVPPAAALFSTPTAPVYAPVAPNPLQLIFRLFGGGGGDGGGAPISAPSPGGTYSTPFTPPPESTCRGQFGQEPTCVYYTNFLSTSCAPLTTSCTYTIRRRTVPPVGVAGGQSGHTHTLSYSYASERTGGNFIGYTAAESIGTASDGSNIPSSIGTLYCQKQ